MKKLIPVLLLCLFTLQSCKEEKTVYIAPVISEPDQSEPQAPTNNQKEDEEKNSDSKRNQQIVKEEEKSLTIKCERDQCDEAVGYIKYKDSICQAVQIEQDKVVVSNSCLEDDLLNKSCSEIYFYNQNETRKCLNIKESGNGYYIVKLNKGLKSLSIEINKEVSNFQDNIYEISFVNKEDKNISESENECQIEFNSVNQLEANDIKSRLLYSLNCKEDFIFSNQEVLGIKIGEDSFGSIFYNMKCDFLNCSSVISKKDKIVQAFYMTSTGTRLIDSFKNSLKQNIKTYTPVNFNLNNEFLQIRRGIECFSITEKEVNRQPTYNVPYEIMENGIIFIDHKNMQRGDIIYYFISFLFEDSPYGFDVIDDERDVMDIFNDAINNINNKKLYDHYFDRYLISEFDVFETTEEIGSYENFILDFNNNNIQHYKKYKVPRCSRHQ